MFVCVFAQIWDIADAFRHSYLTFGEFCVAMRLISIAQVRWQGRLLYDWY